MRIVGEAENGVEALELIKHLEIDLALVDLNLPGIDGFELTQKIVQSSSTKVVILSGDEDRNSISKSIKCGARGYLLKNEFSKEQIIDTINRVNLGYFQMAPGIFEKLINNALDDKFETEQTLSAIENQLHLTSSSSLPDEQARQQLFAELQLKIDNLKLELCQG